MGIMSRRVLPACANVCCFPCPGMRPASKIPTKRYKKLLANIYPPKAATGINERDIGKLADYAAQNPERIPLIANKLEQRGFKDLNSKNLLHVTAAAKAYGKLLSACRTQLPLFALSALSFLQALLDDRDPQMHILGCHLCTDFILSQIDSTYSYNLDKELPRLIAVSREAGEEANRRELRAAGLGALAAMVVATVMDNFTPHHADISAVSRHALHADIPEAIAHLTPTERDHPEVWVHICLRGLAGVMRDEGVAAQQVLGPLFSYLDNGEQWGEGGVALAVLRKLQGALDSEGQGHILLAALVRHLAQPRVTGEVAEKVAIMTITTDLAKRTHICAPSPVVAALNDLVRTLQRGLEDLEGGRRGPEGEVQQNLCTRMEDCLPEFCRLVGDPGAIIDMMALHLDSLNAAPKRSQAAMAALQAVGRSVMPKKQPLPDGFLLHLLQVMTHHPDPQTRVGAHALLPLLIPDPPPPSPASRGAESEDGAGEGEDMSPLRRSARGGKERRQSRGGALHSLSMEVTRSVTRHSGGEMVGAVGTGGRHGDGNREGEWAVSFQVVLPVRLGGAHTALLLSSLWLQRSLPTNTPACYAAMAATYRLVTFAARPKTSSHSVLVRAVQLALSLREEALRPEQVEGAARRRSLLALGTAALQTAAEAYGVPKLRDLAATDASMQEDPFLEVVEGGALLLRQQATTEFASEKDDQAAAAVLSRLEAQLKGSRREMEKLVVAQLPHLLEEEGPQVVSLLETRFEAEDSFMLQPRRFAEEGGEAEVPASGRGEDVVGGEDQPEESVLGLSGADVAGLSQPEVAPSVQSVESILEELATGHCETNERRTAGSEMDPAAVLRGLKEEEEEEGEEENMDFLEFWSVGGTGDPEGTRGGPTLPPPSTNQNHSQAAGC